MWCFQTHTMQYLPTPSGPILDSTLKTVIENLASMEHHTPAQVDPLSDIQSITESMTARFQETLQVGQEPQKTFDQAFAHGMPKFLSLIGPNVANLALIKLELARLTTVSCLVCDHCCGARGAKGITLLKCSRCGLVYHCSMECQKVQWKAFHTRQGAKPLVRSRLEIGSCWRTWPTLTSTTLCTTARL